MDETSKKKRHDYFTIVVDLDKKRSIFVVVRNDLFEKGKGAETVGKFKKDLEEH